MADTVVLLGSVFTRSEFVSISSYKVALSIETLERIRQLRDCVKAQNAYEIEVFNGSTTWYKDMLDEYEDESGNLDTPRLENLTEESTEVDMLHVTQRQCFWSAVPKHGQDEDTVMTVAISIDELEELFNQPESVVTHYTKD